MNFNQNFSSSNLIQNENQNKLESPLSSRIKFFQEKDNNFQEKKKKHQENQKDFRKKHATKMIVLLSANYFSLIIVRELASSYIYSKSIEEKQNLPFNFEMIYWVPNICFATIFGYLCDYAGNENLEKGYTFILNLLYLPILLGQTLNVLSDYYYHENRKIFYIISKILFSISGETLQSFIFGYVTIWFKYEAQFQKICLLTFIGTIGTIFKEIIINCDFLYTTLANRLPLILLLIMFCANLIFFEEESNISKDRSLFIVYKKIYKNSQEKKLDSPFPDSLFTTFHTKLLQTRLIILVLVHGFLCACFFMVFLICDDNIISRSFPSPKYEGFQIPFPLFIFRMIFYFVKGICSIFILPQYIARTGKRNVILFISLMLALVAFINFNNTLVLRYELNLNLFYFSMGLSGLLFIISTAFQQIISFTYIPLLVTEEYYISAYGFFSSIYSIFIVILYSIYYHNSNNLELLIYIMIICLLLILVLFLYLEYFDQRKQPKLEKRKAIETFKKS